jgi:hypothetical protein
VVEEGSAVEARRLSDGSQAWKKTADWSAVAGSDAGWAVVSGKFLVKGYDVTDPATGGLLRHDGQAVAVWTFRNAIVDVRCHAAKDCTLTAWPPRSSTPMWSVGIPGVGFVLFADNPDLKQVRPLTADHIANQAGGPATMPQVLGFPIDGNTYVVDTSQGKVLPEVKPSRQDQIVVTGGRVLRVTVKSIDGSCFSSVIATDAVSGSEVWRQAAMNLRTASGAGCGQRNQPNGADGVLLGLGADGRQGVINAYDGRLLWIGAEGEKALDMDNNYVLVRTANGKAIKNVELGGGRRWQRAEPSNAQAQLTRYGVVITQEGPDKIIVLNTQTGKERLNVHSSAKVLATGSQGIVISDGRLIGYLQYSDLPTPSPASTGAGNAQDPGTRHGTEKD